VSEDWLDIEEAKPAENTGLPAVVVPPVDFATRVAILEAAWAKLSIEQRTFLHAWRENRCNARAANRQLRGRDETYSQHTRWTSDPNYATVMQIWRASYAADALDRDRLLARQDDIVETLLTPKHVMHQGAPTGIMEVEAGAAARANETLMKAAGLLKDKEIEVNVGVVMGGPPTLNIQVMPTPAAATQNGNVVIDAKFTEVPSDDGLDT
jgi:hypothetical protein